MTQPPYPQQGGNQPTPNNQPGPSQGAYPGSGYPQQGGYPQPGGYPQQSIPSQSGGYPQQGVPSQSGGYPQQGYQQPAPGYPPHQAPYAGHPGPTMQYAAAPQPSGTPPVTGSGKSGSKLLIIVVAALLLLGLTGVGLWAVFGNKSSVPQPTPQPTFTVPAQPTATPATPKPTVPPPTTATVPPTKAPQPSSDKVDLGSGITVTVPAGWTVEKSSGSAVLKSPDGSGMRVEAASQVSSDAMTVVTEIRDSHAKRLTGVQLGQVKKLNIDPRIDGAAAAVKGTIATANGSVEVVMSAFVSIHTAKHTGFSVEVLAEPDRLESLKPALEIVLGSGVQSQLEG